MGMEMEMGEMGWAGMEMRWDGTGWETRRDEEKGPGTQRKG